MICNKFKNDLNKCEERKTLRKREIKVERNKHREKVRERDNRETDIKDKSDNCL